MLQKRYRYLILSFTEWHYKLLYSGFFSKNLTKEDIIWFILQSILSPQSPDADREEPSISLEQVGKDPIGHCSREVQVPPTPTTNHNQEEGVEVEETFGNSHMYLSG